MQHLPAMNGVKILETALRLLLATFTLGLHCAETAQMVAAHLYYCTLTLQPDWLLHTSATCPHCLVMLLLLRCRTSAGKGSTLQPSVHHAPVLPLMLASQLSTVIMKN